MRRKKDNACGNRLGRRRALARRGETLSGTGGKKEKHLKFYL